MAHFRKRLTARPIVALWLISIGVAQAEVLKAGDILRLEFTMDTPAFCAGGPCDVIWPFVPYAAEVNVTGSSAILWDGNTELAANDPSGWWYFKSGSSAFGVGSVADFSSIMDGTIQGEIDFSITGGELQGVDLSSAVVYLGHAVSDCCFGANPLTATDTTASILASDVSEPASWAMVALAVGLLTMMGWWRQTRGRMLLRPVRLRYPKSWK